MQFFETCQICGYRRYRSIEAVSPRRDPNSWAEVIIHKGLRRAKGAQSMRFLTSKPGKITIAVALIVVAVSGGLWWHYTRAHPGLVYTSQGYGGYVSAHGNDQDKHKADPLRLVVIAYNAGHYKDAEAAAQRLIDGTSDSKSPAVRKRAVKARYILAFSGRSSQRSAVG